MRSNSRVRRLDIERLEQKASPASLLEAISLVDCGAADCGGEFRGAEAQVSVELAALSAPESLHWTCCPTSQEILHFIQTNTIECSLNEDEGDGYEFHRLQDDDYVAAADHAIELLSGAVIKASLTADQIEFS